MASIKILNNKVVAVGSDMTFNGDSLATKDYVDANAGGGGTVYSGDEFAEVQLTGGGLELKNTLLNQRLQNTNLDVVTQSSQIADSIPTSGIRIFTGTHNNGDASSGGILIATGNCGSGSAGAIYLNPGASGGGAGARADVAIASQLDMSSQRIKNLADPVNAQDAVNFQTLQSAVGGAPVIVGNNTSRAQAPNNVWLSFLGNFLSLTGGQYWELNATILFQIIGGTYSLRKAGWYSSAGDDTGLNPDPLADAVGILNPYFIGPQYFTETNASTEIVNVAPLIVNGSSDIYFNINVTSSNPIGTEIILKIWARKLG